MLAVLLAANARGKITRLHKADRASLEQPATIKMLFSTSQLPSSVKAACASATADHKFWLAKPSGRFEETDTVSGLWPLPSRRLIWIAQLPGYFVVHYEYGGRGLSNHILVVHRDSTSGEANLVWACVGHRFDNYREFQKALQNNELDDSLPYYH